MLAQLALLVTTMNPADAHAKQMLCEDAEPCGTVQSGKQRAGQTCRGLELWGRAVVHVAVVLGLQWGLGSLSLCSCI